MKSAQEGFEGVRQGRDPLAPRMQFLAASQCQVSAQLHVSALLRQRTTVDQPGAGFGQVAFGGIRVPDIEGVAENQLKHGIAEEF